MATKWLHLAVRRNQPTPQNGDASETHPQMYVPPAPEPPENFAPEQATSTGQGDLLSLEDIYRTAGILTPRMGYSILKIVEMLKSDHMRGLSSENKRSAVLMALDAAGISLDDVIRDATLRLRALSSCQSDQHKQFEEYWTAKAEENAHIQDELERLTSHYLAHINHNLQAVAQEKDMLRSWESMTHMEKQRISEALDLCRNSSSASSSEEALAVF
jgi:hypothetical protein